MKGHGFGSLWVGGQVVTDRSESAALLLGWGFGVAEDTTCAAAFGTWLPTALTPLAGASAVVSGLATIDPLASTTEQVAALGPLAATIRQAVASVVATDPQKARALSKLADLAEDPGLYGATTAEVHARLAWIQNKCGA